MNAAERILERLHSVRQTGPSRWIARCPAHEDRSPSLSIRVTDDERVLAHCHAGCEIGEVLGALGLELRDLFVQPLAHHLPPIRTAFTARELLELNAHEATVVALLAEKAAANSLTAAESDRLLTAAGRLGKAEALSRGR